MLQQCTRVCKVTFLLIIIIIAAYFIAINEKTIREKFTSTVSGGDTNNKNAYTETIKTVIQTYLLRPPEQYEIERYRLIMNFPQDAEPVIDAVKKTNEYQNIVKATTRTADLSTLTPIVESSTSLDQYVESAPLKERTDVYRTIISIYDKQLERMPTMRELNYYSYRMMSDKAFDAQKLTSILQASREFDILQKNQSNSVHAELPMNVTDAQVTYDVRRLYKDIFGEEPGAEIERFLKFKYREMNLDEKRFIDFMLLLKALDKNNISVKRLDDGNVAITNSVLKTMDKTIDNTVSDTHTLTDIISRGTGSSSKGNTVYNNQKIYNIINPSSSVLKALMDTMSTAGIDVTDEDTYLPSKSRVNISDTQITKTDTNTKKNTSCTSSYSFMTAAENDYRSRNGLAEAQTDRNMDELRSSCLRNTYFLNADDNMVLFPEHKWEVPQKRPPVCVGGDATVQPMTEQTSLIGTLLSDAENTKVGSMLPKFVYKELSQQQN